MMGETVTFRLNKLVRDKLPDIMRDLGETPEVIKLRAGELEKALIEKIKEELNELDPDSESYIDELADLNEAFEALIGGFVDRDALETARITKTSKTRRLRERSICREAGSTSWRSLD